MPEHQQQQEEAQLDSSVAEHVLHSCGHAIYPHLQRDSRHALRRVCTTACNMLDTHQQAMVIGKQGQAPTAHDILRRPAIRRLQIRKVLREGEPFYTNVWTQGLLPLHLVHLELFGCLRTPTPANLAPLTYLASWLLRLELVNNRLSDEGSCFALASTLSTLTSLQHLRVERNKMEGRLLATALAPALPCLTQLTCLELTQANCAKSGGRVVSALSGLSRLQHLALGISMTPPSRPLITARCSAARALVPVLQQLTSLTSLELGCPRPLWKDTDATIPHLGIMSCGDLLSLSEALLEAPWLQSLSLTRRPAWEWFGFGLPTAELTALRTLGLRGGFAPHFPGVREVYGEDVARVLHGLPALTALDLSENTFKDQDWVELGPALGRLSQLRTLDLHDMTAKGTCTWPPVDSVAAALAAALPRLTQLTSLDLQGCFSVFHDEGAEVLLVSIAQLGGCLEYLDLRGCSLGSKEGRGPAALALQQVRERLAGEQGGLPAVPFLQLGEQGRQGTCGAGTAAREGEWAEERRGCLQHF